MRSVNKVILLGAVGKEIPLSQGLVAVVDEIDHERLSQNKWFAWKKKDGVFYARRMKTVGIKKQITVHMHREVMSAPDGMVVDHINGNTLDNRRSNLRVCTVGQNNAHLTRLKSNNKSGFTGVSWHSSARKWAATIKRGNQHIYLGVFDTPEEAAAVRDEAAKKSYGEFAYVNLSEDIN